MVEDEPPLGTVLDDFHVWLSHENLLIDDDHSKEEEKVISSSSRNKSKFAFVTCGDWDLKKLLPTQLKALGLDVPHYFLSWINIKIVIYTPFARNNAYTHIHDTKRKITLYYWV